MDSISKLYLQRAQNELNLSVITMKVSKDPQMQLSLFGLKQDTYYNGVITHAYYCIFYSAKAYLKSKDIKVEAPEEHRKTYEEFSKFVDKGVLDKELLEIYNDAWIKAENLLEIFREEKKKRGEFTYQKLPQANMEPAEKSLENSEKFFKIIYNLLD